MLFPIFIPIHHYDDDSDRKHGYGCKCPECLVEERLNNLPRVYYKCRYAIPRKFVIKNTLFKVLCWTIAIVGGFTAISPLFFFSLFHGHSFLMFLCVPVGFLVVMLSFMLYSYIVKEYYSCNDKIYMEIKDSFLSTETWEEKIKSMGIPKNYVLTKEESIWMYK